MRTVLRLALLSALLLPAATPRAQTNAVESALTQLRADIAAATDELARTRGEIAAQRLPLAARIEAARREVISLRAEHARQLELRRGREREEAARTERIARQEEEYRYLSAALQEYARAAQARLHELEAARPGIAAPAAPEEETIASFPAELFRRLAEGIERLRQRRAGRRFAATVVDERGVELKGTAVLLGPLAFFATPDGSRAGSVGTRFGRATPSLEEPAAPEDRARIRALVAGGESPVPVDPSGGLARRMEEARGSWKDDFGKGGFVMWPLAAVGLLALLLSLGRAAALSRIRADAPEIWRGALDRVRAGDIGGARQTAGQAPEPLRSLFQEGIVCREVPRGRLEEILHEHLLGFLPALERHLGTLAVLGGIAPLLGLLGTVTGMIHTFQLVTVFGSGDARLLSGGISEALITTKYGLIIAVPVLLAHALLARRARRLLSTLEQTALGVVNDLKGREAE